MSSTARRAFLKSAGAAVAAGAAVVPAGAAGVSCSDIPTTDADPELEALYARFVASHEVAEQAGRRLDDLEESVQFPPWPDALLVQPRDVNVFDRLASPDVDGGPPRYRDVSELKHWLRRHETWNDQTDAELADGQRAREIIAAREARSQAVDEILVSSGVEAGRTEVMRLWLANRADREALAAAQAATVGGVLLKLQTILALERDEETLNDWRVDEVIGNGDTSTGLAVSLTLDLMRLWGLVPGGVAA